MTTTTQSTKLAREDVAQLFTVPQSDWTAINTRVGLAIYIEKAGAAVEQSLPSYYSLAAASEQWRGSTFPAIVTHAAALAAYASDAIAGFSSLQTRIAALSPTTTALPSDLEISVRTTLQQLHDATTTQANTASSLAKSIDSFRIVNDAADNDIARLNLGAMWSAVSAQSAAIASAIAHVEGTWSALVNDVTSLTDADAAVTMPFLAALDLDAAVVAWQRVHAEAIAFGSMAAGQQKFLNR